MGVAWLVLVNVLPWVAFAVALLSLRMSRRSYRWTERAREAAADARTRQFHLEQAGRAVLRAWDGSPGDDLIEAVERLRETVTRPAGARS